MQANDQFERLHRGYGQSLDRKGNISRRGLPRFPTGELRGGESRRVQRLRRVIPLQVSVQNSVYVHLIRERRALARHNL